MRYLLCLLAAIFVQATNGEARLVRIAVVEYHPFQNLTPDAKIRSNTDQYVETIKFASQPKLDLIVFPEATLSNNPQTAVEVQVNANPCDFPKSDLLRYLSCAARTSTTYLVVNLVEKEKCSNTSSNDNCNKEGFFYFNTDVIFDRNGTILNKYRKYNLFGEKELDRTSSPERVVVTTDWGEKFGIFTCFDILFKSPPEDLLKMNIDGAIFPTMWFSELPFLTALQTQQMWAHAHNTTLIAAGANNPPLGSGGTGYYKGDQGLITGGIDPSVNTNIYIYTYTTGGSLTQQTVVPQDTDSLAGQMDKFYLNRDSSIDEYKSIVLDSSTGDFQKGVCYGNENGTGDALCCYFHVKMVADEIVTNKKSYVYHLVAFSGVRSFSGTYNGGVEVCGIIACLNSSLSSCGRRFPNYDDIVWPITFNEIMIQATFEKSENRTQYPNSLLSSIRPISAQDTAWEKTEVTVNGKAMIQWNFSLKKQQNRLLTFAIYGRSFDKDFPNEKDSATSVTAYFFVAVFVALVSVLV